jgi:hypothetical protein
MSRKSNLHLFSGLLGFGTLFLVTASLALAYPWPLAPQDVQRVP